MSGMRVVSERLSELAICRGKENVPGREPNIRDFCEKFFISKTTELCLGPFKNVLAG